MTTLEQVIAEHYPSGYTCGCGREINSGRGWGEHVAGAVRAWNAAEARGHHLSNAERADRLRAALRPVPDISPEHGRRIPRPPSPSALKMAPTDHDHEWSRRGDPDDPWMECWTCGVVRNGWRPEMWVGK